MNMTRIRSGQTLVFLLVFMAMSTIITTAAVVMIILNSRSATRMEQGIGTYQIAESGLEDALMRILRNPNYTTGGTPVTLTIGSGTATITVSGVGTKTITSVGTDGGFRRELNATAAFVNGSLLVTSWQEVY